MDAIGFVVNPIAGMGGRVGLKGTDGVLEEARRRGATPRAPARARTAMAVLAERRPDLTVYTAPGEMGAAATSAAGLEPTIVHEFEGDRPGVTDPEREGLDTTATDTRATVAAALERGVDLVVFVGGDGTAVDVATAIEDRGADTPMLGVPAGVKVYSSVFGTTPAEAGRIAAELDRTEYREVTDIDEAAYRDGEVATSLEAVVRTPVDPGLQAGKHRVEGDVTALAAGVADEVDPAVTYVFGPGGTVGAIQERLGMDPSPLGVDVWRDGTVLARDASETEVLEAVAAPAEIVVSPIGGQGFLFGRGNQQLSPRVIDRAETVTVVATERKLDELEALRVDTDDESLNESLQGWHRVRTGRFTTRLMRIV